MLGGRGSLTTGFHSFFYLQGVPKSENRPRFAPNSVGSKTIFKILSPPKRARKFRQATQHSAIGGGAYWAAARHLFAIMTYTTTLQCIPPRLTRQKVLKTNFKDNNNTNYYYYYY